MIDLHTHTKFSNDGIIRIDQLLKKAEKNKLDYFAISDHNNVDAYKIDIPKYKNLFSGKIINGVEINSKVLKYPVEILSYGHDIIKMDEFLQTYFSYKKRLALHIKKVHFLFKVADKFKLKYDKKVLNVSSIDTYATDIFFTEIRKYPKNKEKFPEEVWDNDMLFYRKYFTNPNNKEWYFNAKNVWPSSAKLIDAIHKCNGLAFLAHPFEYKHANTTLLLDTLVKQKIDGIESYHLSSQGEKNKFLIDYAQKNNLFMSGGSDYHGTISSRNNIIGDKNMPFTIPTNTITNWVKLINN